MKKFFTLIAMAFIAISSNAQTSLDLPSAWGEGIKDGSNYTFNGTWQGAATWVGGDWSAYDCVWVKYSALTGNVDLKIQYDEWTSHQSWGDVFAEQSVALTGESGIAVIYIDKTTTFVKGSQETDGEHIGETYDKHVRQVVLQDHGTASTVTIEGLWVGTQAQYLEATGYNASANHALQAANGTAGTNNWDRQAVVTLKQSLEVDKTYEFEMTVLCGGGHFQLVPIFSTSTNTNQWGGSNDVQYIDFNQDALADKTMVLKAKFKAAFPHDKLQIFSGTIAGDIFFDNISCKEEGSDVELIENGDFENINISNWAGTNCAVSHVEKDMGEIFVPEVPKTVDLPLDNLSSGGAQYDVTTHTITLIEDGTNKGWWFGTDAGSARDYSDYDNVVIQMEATANGGAVAVEYNGGADNSSVQFFPGATCVVVKMDEAAKNNVKQIYLIGEVGNVYTLTAAFVAKEEATPAAALGTETGIQTVKAAEKIGEAYNIAGQRVASGYKGLVIVNGKKVIKK